MFYRPAAPVPAEALQQRNVEFTRTAWRVGLRPDQRADSQLRELVVDYPLLTREVAQVRCGGTTASATVSCELVEPSATRPKHGFFEVHVRQLLQERDSLSKPKELRRLGAFLERLLKGSVLDTEGLCVLPGRRVWSVCVEVLVLNDEGNAADVAQWATMAALLHYRRPELTIRGETITVHSPHERDPVPLTLHHVPLCCTFALTLDERRLALEARAAAVKLAGSGSSPAEKKEPTAGALLTVVDPSLEEAAAAACTVVVAVNSEGQVCTVEKGEGSDASWPLLQSCVNTATEIVPCILETMHSAMKEHDARREKAMKAQFLWVQQRGGVGATTAVTATSADDTTGKDSQEPEAKKIRVE